MLEVHGFKGNLKIFMNTYIKNLKQKTTSFVFHILGTRKKNKEKSLIHHEKKDKRKDLLIL